MLSRPIPTYIGRCIATASLTLALAGITASLSFAQVDVYDYDTSANSGLTLIQPRATNNADFGTLLVTPGFDISVTSITVARAHGTTDGSFDVGFFMWGGVDFSAPAGTSVFSNLLISGTFNRSVTAANQGQIFTTAFTVTPGTLILPSGFLFGYQMVYAAPGTINTTTAAYTPTTLGVGAFFADRGTGNAGQSTDDFFVNDNATGIVEVSDAVGFNAPNEAFGNVYLNITGTLVPSAVVPEPNTLALLAFGVAPVAGVVIARRRKKA